ncbi:pyridoxal phosphate-dependent aminotransferase [Catenuloplanes indicus]|uniref:histidinol-phosphate transaminase n=1 Tax=Catenuloplanes indicus TaxID=137267 RepID=A0AAE3W2L0_9ACTN|nr:histidinol-phosphate transaminase [Catenuloplanes indicus]MDQ0368376.1 histidinol-phosphate/aromatic aminotransferase/cobyric acid decarboxylase-like protein [Catenuloplanes indicus]
MRHGSSIDLSLLRQGAHSASIATLQRNMGEGARIVDFCIPCNPYFPTPEMFAELSANLESILKYYPSSADTITKQLCSALGLHPQTVAMANGSTELITWIDHLLIRESVAIPIPTFGRWTDQPLETGKRVDMYPLQEADNYQLDLDDYARFIRQRGSRVAVICNPNNPDGGYIPRREILRFVDMLHDLDLVVIDESFIDFVDQERQPSVAAEAGIRSNMLVLKSLGKNFGLHGIRFGYMVANPALTTKIGSALPKWNLNSLAETVVHMIKDHEAEYRESLRRLSRDRMRMADELTRVPGLTVWPSQGNFLLVKLGPGWDGVELRDFLISRYGIYVRECGNKLGMTSQYLRFVVRPPEDVLRLVDGMHAYGRYLHSEGMMHVEAEHENADLIVHPANRAALTNGTGMHAVVR